MQHRAADFERRAATFTLPTPFAAEATFGALSSIFCSWRGHNPIPYRQEIN
jgi:hypothetical protein